MDKMNKKIFIRENNPEYGYLTMEDLKEEAKNQEIVDGDKVGVYELKKVGTIKVTTNIRIE